MVNVELMQKVLDHITNHRDEWDQTAWATKTSFSSCGTAYCFAGHAVHMTGHELAWSKQQNGQAVFVKWEQGDDPGEHAISYVAKEELELAGWQAAALFDSDNTLPMLYEYASEFTNGAIEIPEEYKHAWKTRVTYASDLIEEFK